MVKFRVTKYFFDRSEVLKAKSRGVCKALSHFGGYVRKVARNSIKKRKGISTAGAPPHSHAGHLKDFIFYSYDRLRENVVIGPQRLRGKSEVSGKTVPELLEEGGTWVRKVKRKKDGKKVTIKRHLRERPFMSPANLAGQKKLPDYLKDSIGK